MKVTIFRKQKDGNSESIANEELSDYIDRVKKEANAGFINKYRMIFSSLESPRAWVNIDRIPMVCPGVEYHRNRAGQRIFSAYNGVSVITIDGLNDDVEVANAKRYAALFPHTFYAMKGADGHSVTVWTLATLPDSTLPKSEKLAALFCEQAYNTSVLCYASSCEYHIHLEEPKLDKCIMMTYDPAPYVNPHPTPLIIEQPTEDSIALKLVQGKSANALNRMKPSMDTYTTFTQMFNAAYHRAYTSIHDWDKEQNHEAMMTRVADECAICGLPEEETFSRLRIRFHQLPELDVRTTVRSVYEEHEGDSGATRLPFSKHQAVALKLREFLNRRYEIRHNEVLALTEFRERESLRFLFRELNRRELNTIHHEALLEGIEPTFGEVDELVHSTFVPTYNPITDYINNLPKWDGKDRITALCDMVPNSNPHWRRLFTRWFLSMVAHWMNYDTVHANQTAPILIGAQGYRKSTFCRLLLPPELQAFFTDSIDFRSKIEAERCLERFLLVNIDEFDQLSETQFAFVKHLFQKPSSNRRRMYSETISAQRRYASFIGTSNHREILRDPTGNRRYLCIEVIAPIRTEEAIDYRQLYAQARQLVLDGERYWLNDEDESLIRQSNEVFEVASPLEQLFLTAFSVPQNGEEGEWLSMPEILSELQKLSAFNRRTDNHLNKMGRVLTKLAERGLQKHRKTNQVVYYVKRRAGL